MMPSNIVKKMLTLQIFLVSYIATRDKYKQIDWSRSTPSDLGFVSCVDYSLL